MKKLLTKHLEEAEENYFQHLLFTLKMGFSVIVTGILIVIHGLFPFIMTKTASGRLTKIYATMQARAKHDL